MVNCLILAYLYRSIDAQIGKAELEYKIEKDQLDILNISHKIQVIRISLEKKKYIRELIRQECLYNYVKEAEIASIVTCEMTKDNLNSVDIRPEGSGLVINLNNSAKLISGDRMLELEGVDVFRITSEEWGIMKSQIGNYANAVFLRTKTGDKANNKQGNIIAEDIAMIQSKLEQKLKAGQHVSTELVRAQKRIKRTQG